MARKAPSLLMRAASSLANALKRKRARDDGDGRAGTAEPPQQSARKKPRREPGVARPTRRDTDIPLDRIEQTYTPTQTSVKAPFRTSGADHQRDQEFARGVADDRWNDEDRYTNKSADPRIGTHGRTYEPGE